jgi:hypothetical protein
MTASIPTGIWFGCPWERPEFLPGSFVISAVTVSSMSVVANAMP